MSGFEPLALARPLFEVGVVAGIWFLPELIARVRGVRWMRPATLRRKVAVGDREVVILDVRPEAEYRAAHIPGAKHLPLERIAAGAPLLASMKGADVVCVCTSGKRSAMAAMRLRKAGFPTVYNLTGGMLFWGRKHVEHG